MFHSKLWATSHRNLHLGLWPWNGVSDWGNILEVGLLIDFSNYSWLIDWLIDWLTDWLNEWHSWWSWFRQYMKLLDFACQLLSKEAMLIVSFPAETGDETSTLKPIYFEIISHHIIGCIMLYTTTYIYIYRYVSCMCIYI